VAGSVGSVRELRPGPSARYNLDPLPHRVPPKFGNVLIGERISEVPADAPNNHLAWEMTAFERIEWVIGMDLYTNKPLARFSQMEPSKARPSY
jgi:hypothetical protein